MNNEREQALVDTIQYQAERISSLEKSIVERDDETISELESDVDSWKRAHAALTRRFYEVHSQLESVAVLENQYRKEPVAYGSVSVADSLRSILEGIEPHSLADPSEWERSYWDMYKEWTQLSEHYEQLQGEMKQLARYYRGVAARSDHDGYRVADEIDEAIFRANGE